MRSNFPFQSNSSSKFLSRLPVLRLDDLPSLEWSWFVSHRCAETFENVTRYDKSSVDLSSTIWSLTLARGAAWLAKKRDPRLMHRPWQSKSHQASFLAYIMSLSLAVEGESSFFFSWIYNFSGNSKNSSFCNWLQPASHCPMFDNWNLRGYCRQSWIDDLFSSELSVE